MHRDLLNWEMAMQLAEKDAPREIPYISREFAQQLEFQSAFGKALSLHVTRTPFYARFLSDSPPLLARELGQGRAIAPLRPGPARFAAIRQRPLGRSK